MNFDAQAVQIILLIVSFLTAIIGFLAGLVSVMVLTRMSRFEKSQDAMKDDWMGKKETNYMVKRVEEQFNDKHSQLKESVDNLSAEVPRMLERAVDSIKQNVKDCSDNILRQVAMAIKATQGGPIKVDDILGHNSGSK